MNASGSRPSVILENGTVRVRTDLGGGSITSFQFQPNGLNPLNWDSWHLGPTPDAPPTSDPRWMGHFLCLDRWGAASAAEAAHGMGYHGEASVVWWTVDQPPSNTDGSAPCMISAELPLAGLKVEREFALIGDQPCLLVTETITNIRHLGRIYNCVQHPTIAPPFLDPTTIVDCNATRGFMQDTPMPNPEDPEVGWPKGLNPDGIEVDLRSLDGTPVPEVVSYIIEDEIGWVTAANPGKGLLLGYLWPTRDYPWFSIWSNLEGRKPTARGIEFGTTGLHQTGHGLVAKGKIFDRQLFRFIDADESQTFRYAAFLAKIPSDYTGTERVEYKDSGVSIFERGNESRTIRLETDQLF